MNHVQQLIYLCQPICDMIHIIESDCCSIADMIATVEQLERISLKDFTLFQGTLKDAVQKLIDDTRKSIKTPSALLANVLHPSYRGKNLTQNERMIASSYVPVFAKNLSIDVKAVVASYMEFINDENYFSDSFIRSIDHNKPISWWKFVKNMSDHKLLAEIALRFLHIQPTNASVERSFFQQKFIHRKERNLLSSSSANKLQTIRSNLRTFESKESFNERKFVLESDPESDEYTDTEHPYFELVNEDDDVQVVDGERAITDVEAINDEEQGIDDVGDANIIQEAN